MTKQEWLLILRQFNKLDSLEKIIDKKKYELDNSELAVFWGAADHRLVELITGHLYDKIPPSAWRLVH